MEIWTPFCSPVWLLSYPEDSSECLCKTSEEHEHEHWSPERKKGTKWNDKYLRWSFWFFLKNQMEVLTPSPKNLHVRRPPSCTFSPVDCLLNLYPHRELATNGRDHSLDTRHNWPAAKVCPTTFKDKTWPVNRQRKTDIDTTWHNHAIIIETKKATVDQDATRRHVMISTFGCG